LTFDVGGKLVPLFLGDPESRQEPPTHKPARDPPQIPTSPQEIPEIPTSTPKWVTNCNFIDDLSISDPPGGRSPPGMSQIHKIVNEIAVCHRALVGISGVSCGLVGICGRSLAVLWGVLAGIPGSLRRGTNNGEGLPPRSKSCCCIIKCFRMGGRRAGRNRGAGAGAGRKQNKTNEPRHANRKHAAPRRPISDFAKPNCSSRAKLQF
jgi:hypothetical protein